MKRLAFTDLPWDCLEVVLDFLPLNEAYYNSPEQTQVGFSAAVQKTYQVVRLISRDIYRLINKRRKALIFKDRAIASTAFLDLVRKASGRPPTTVGRRTPLVSNLNSLKQFAIMCRLTNLTMTDFNKWIIPIPGL